MPSTGRRVPTATTRGMENLWGLWELPLGCSGPPARKIICVKCLFPLNQPEVMIANAAEKFDEQGDLIDLKTSEKIKTLLEALVDWTRRLKKARA